MSHLQPMLESQYGVITSVYPMNITGTLGHHCIIIMNSDGVIVYGVSIITCTSLYMMNSDGVIVYGVSIITSLYMVSVSLHHCIWCQYHYIIVYGVSIIASLYMMIVSLDHGGH